MFEIVLAERDSAPITAAIIGGSGAGKTYSALLFARGLAGPDGKICVIDTEGGRPKIYAKDPKVAPFYILDLPSPYTSDRFREAFRTAEKWGAHVIIVDTISHEHEGFLEFADAEEARIEGAKKSRNKWIKPKAARKRFYSSISSSHAHTIVTIRLNRIVDMESKPPREIMKPECDKDLPYRLDLSMTVEKLDRTDIPTTTYIKVPGPLKPFIENGVALDVRHGQILAADISQQKPHNDKLRATIAALEDVASSGVDTYKTAFEAAYRNTPEADRPELMRNHERLKAVAIEADKIAEDDAFPGDRDGGELFNPRD